MTNTQHFPYFPIPKLQKLSKDPLDVYKNELRVLIDHARSTKDDKKNSFLFRDQYSCPYFYTLPKKVHKKIPSTLQDVQL